MTCSPMYSTYCIATFYCSSIMTEMRLFPFKCIEHTTVHYFSVHLMFTDFGPPCERSGTFAPPCTGTVYACNTERNIYTIYKNSSLGTVCKPTKNAYHQMNHISRKEHKTW